MTDMTHWHSLTIPTFYIANIRNSYTMLMHIKLNNSIFDLIYKNNNSRPGTASDTIYVANDIYNITYSDYYKYVDYGSILQVVTDLTKDDMILLNINCMNNNKYITDLIIEGYILHHNLKNNFTNINFKKPFS